MSYNYDEKSKGNWDDECEEEKCCSKEESCVKVNIYTECDDDKKGKEDKWDKGDCGCVEVNIFVKCD